MGPTTNDSTDFVPAALALLPVAAALACAAVILTLLRQPQWHPLDRPNERSLHVAPTPRIGGLGIVAGTLLAFALLRAEPLLAALVAVLAVMSYLDDRSHLPIAIRFGAHAVAAVVFVLATTPDLHPLWQAALALATMWMTNLYNFMDGSDGLAGGMALFGFGAYGSPPGSAAMRCSCVVAAALPPPPRPFSSSTSRRRGYSWATPARCRWASSRRRWASSAGAPAIGRGGSRSWCSRPSSSTRA